MKNVVTVCLLGLVLVACFSKELEIHTSEPVDIYSKPAWPELAGNQKVGTLPANVILPVKREIFRKDLAAYEVEYKTLDGFELRGYVLLGSKGLEVKRKQ